jgi:GcrA cell cycle regulator
MTTTWTDERVETLRRLWNEGYSATQIAQTLRGVSRNAVIGKLHRLGAPRRASVPQKLRKPAARQRKAERLVPQRYSAPPAPVLREVDIVPVNVPLEALNAPIPFLPDFGMCRAVTDDREWGRPLYCGHQCGDASFCSAHAARFYVPAPPPKPKPNYTWTPARRIAGFAWGNAL